MTVRHAFRKIAHATAAAIGSPYAFIAALSVVLIWGACGPLFHFSDTWQLAINTSTTIVTFLVVFMIQNSQNRDSQAIHLKLDELICSVKTARNQLIDVEDLDDEELAKLALEFRRRRSEPDTVDDEDDSTAERPTGRTVLRTKSRPPAADPTGRTGKRRKRASEGMRREAAAAAAELTADLDVDPGADAKSGDAPGRQPVAESPGDRARPGAPTRTPSASAR